MINDLEQMIKEKLLQDLIDRMSDSSGDRMKPKGVGVEVQAKDPKALADGLDKAKELVGDKGSDEDRMAAMAKGGSDDDDLLQLLGDDEDEDKE